MNEIENIEKSAGEIIKKKKKREKVNMLNNIYFAAMKIMA